MGRPCIIHLSLSACPPGGWVERLKWMIGGRAVWSNLIFFISALGWNEYFISAVCWKNENFISAVCWNGIYWLKWICATKRWIYGRASRPIHHTNTIQIHVSRAGQANRAGRRAHAHAHASMRAPSSWNGTQQLKWNFHFSIQLKEWNFHFSPKLKWKSIKLLVAQHDHFPFHLRASVELPVASLPIHYCHSN